MFSLQKHKIENIKSLIKVFTASFLPMIYAIIYNCINYVILLLFLISKVIYFIFTERSTILDYISGNLGRFLASTQFIRSSYISDDN